MKIYSIMFTGFAAAVVSLSMISCEKEGTCNETNISTAGSDDSHNFGQNCMSCHTSGGEGEGCFKIAGSVSNSGLTAPLTSGTVKLYTQANGAGTLKHTFQIDTKGNFHTTDAVDFTGLFAAVTGSNGVTQYMSTSLTSGACNSCHGPSTSKLWAN